MKLARGKASGHLEWPDARGRAVAVEWPDARGRAVAAINFLKLARGKASGHLEWPDARGLNCYAVSLYIAFIFSLINDGRFFWRSSFLK